MKILIDADGCPVVNITVNLGRKYNINTIIMCDTSHIINKVGVDTVVLSKGSDSVDFALVNKVSKGDIVVTQDYGLAAMVLSKGGYPINQNGMIYSNENIDQLLFTRHLSKKIRNSGQRTKGPKKRTKDDDIKDVEVVIVPFNPETSHTVIIKGKRADGSCKKAVLEYMYLSSPTAEYEKNLISLIEKLIY